MNKDVRYGFMITGLTGNEAEQISSNILNKIKNNNAVKLNLLIQSDNKIT